MPSCERIGRLTPERRSSERIVAPLRDIVQEAYGARCQRPKCNTVFFKEGVTVERREVLRLSLGALLTGAVGTAVSPVAGKSPTSAEDVVASDRYNNERRFLATSYGRIAYIDRGAGDEVLFLHGFPLSSFQWRGAIDRLSSGRRCVAPDLMGLGYTEVQRIRVWHQPPKWT
jgi:hypothetical protein